MSGESHSCQRKWLELPLSQRSHGSQYLWHQRWDRENWMETVPGVHRMDLCRACLDLLLLRRDEGQNARGTLGDL